MIYDIFKICGRFPVFLLVDRRLSIWKGESDMEKHTEHKLLHKAIERISYRYRHEKALSSFKEKKLRYLSMNEDEFLLSYIEISARCICKKWILFFSSMIWLMMTISLSFYVKKLLAVLPTIADQEYRSTILLISVSVPAMILLPWLICLIHVIRQYRRMKEKMIMDEVRRYLRENIHDDENRRVL